MCLICNCGGLHIHDIEVVISPPALYLLIVREHLKKEIEVCSQNVFDKPNGAFTGEISASQLVDSKIGWTLTGHSERRVILKENDEVRAAFSVNRARLILFPFRWD